MDIDSLSDHDLYAQLRVYRPHLGPVVDSTRALYRNLLRKALNGELSPSGSPNTSLENRVKKSPAKRRKQDEEDSIDDEQFEVLGAEIPVPVKPYEEEWVQNDPMDLESPGRFTFFLKSIFFGGIVALIAIAFIQYWVEEQNKKH